MKKQIIYPALIPRMFATTLDLFLLAILSTPLTTFISFKLSEFLFKVNIAEILIKSAENLEALAVNNFSNLLIFIALMAMVNIIIVGTYFISFWVYYGATPGKMIMHMKIVNAVTLEQPGKWQFIKRFCGYFTALFGIWSIVVSKQRQALHDKMAQTVVIKR